MDVRLHSWLKQAQAAQAATAVRESRHRLTAHLRSLSEDLARPAHPAPGFQPVSSWRVEALAHIAATKAPREREERALREADSNPVFAYWLNEVAFETATLNSDQLSRIVRVVKTWRDWNRAAAVITPTVGAGAAPALNTYLREVAPLHPAVAMPDGRTRRWFKRWRAFILQALERGLDGLEIVDAVATVAPPTTGSDPGGVPRRARPLPNWLHELLENTIEPGAPFVARLRKTSIGEPALV